MRKHLLLNASMISFVFFLTPTMQASDVDEKIQICNTGKKIGVILIKFQ